MTIPPPTIRWIRFVAIIASLVTLCLFSACGSKETAATSSPPAGSPTVALEKIRIKDGAGARVFSFKQKEDGAKLVDAQETEIARYTFDGDKVKVKDAADRVLGYLVGQGDRFKLESSDQEKLLFKLQRQTDGDWKLEGPDDVLIYKVKKRAYGFEIEDPDEKSMSKIKVKGGKTSLRDSRDQTVYSTKDPIRPEAMACLGMDGIENLALRGALLVRLNWPGTQR